MTQEVNRAESGEEAAERGLHSRCRRRGDESVGADQVEQIRIQSAVRVALKRVARDAQLGGDGGRAGAVAVHLPSRSRSTQAAAVHWSRRPTIRLRLARPASGSGYGSARDSRRGALPIRRTTRRRADRPPGSPGGGPARDPTRRGHHSEHPVRRAHEPPGSRTALALEVVQRGEFPAVAQDVGQLLHARLCASWSPVFMPGRRPASARKRHRR